jgi:hypothetical protein
MRTIYGILAILLLGAITFYACKKDSTTTNSETSNTTANMVNQVQTSESQDATANKVETDIDNEADDLEANGYTTTNTKAAASTCVSISIDSTSTKKSWPRTITLNYNCNDTVNGEVMIQTGIVSISIDTLTINKRRGYSRSITFNNYSIKTDSSTIVINGTRNLKRIAVIPSLTSTNYRLELKDSVTSNLNFSINYVNYKGTADTTVTFTRKAARVRDVVLNYTKVLRIWVNHIKNDTITFTGQVSGVDIIGKSYVRMIPATNPIVVSYCPIWPHNEIITGEIDLTSNGTAIATITYTADGCSTNATLTTPDGKIKNKKISRKFGLSLKKWW